MLLIEEDLGRGPGGKDNKNIEAPYFLVRGMVFYEPSTPVRSLSRVSPGRLVEEVGWVGGGGRDDGTAVIFKAFNIIC